MGKGCEPRKVNKEKYDKNFTLIFGEKKLNIMSDKDREEMLRNTIEEIEKPYFDRLDEIRKDLINEIGL